MKLVMLYRSWGLEILELTPWGPGIARHRGRQIDGLREGGGFHLCLSFCIQLDYFCVLLRSPSGCYIPLVAGVGDV